VQLNNSGPNIRNSNVSGPIGGDGMVVQGNIFGADQEITTYEEELVRAVRDAQLQLSEEAAQGLERGLVELQEGGEGRSSAIQRLIGMAQMLGDVGVPVVEAGRRLVEALR
jgi:hypothetical protein